MLADSRPLNLVEQFAFSPVGEPMCLYGDPAYSWKVKYMYLALTKVELISWNQFLP